MNIDKYLQLTRNISAFALDNDGFRFALATSQGAKLDSFSKDAETSWKKSSTAVFEIVRKIKEMDKFSTTSILNLNESYQAVQEMCRVSYIIDCLKKEIKYFGLILKVLADIQSDITIRKQRMKTYLMQINTQITSEQKVRNKNRPPFTTTVTETLRYPQV